MEPMWPPCDLLILLASLPGLADDFLDKQNAAEYRVCRIANVDDTKTFIGHACSPRGNKSFLADVTLDADKM